MLENKGIGSNVQVEKLVSKVESLAQEIIGTGKSKSVCYFDEPFKDKENYSDLKSSRIKYGIAYIRYSDRKQDQNNSVEIQKRQILLKAKLEGYQIIYWCIDKAISATQIKAGDRKAMQVLYKVALVDEFKNCGIFFYEESRVSRQASDFVMDIYNPLIEERAAIKFFSTSEPGEWDAKKPHIQAKLLIYQYESKIKKDRVIGLHDTCLHPETGKPRRPGGSLPYGYIRGEDKLPVIEMSEAVVIYLIFYLSSWGKGNKTIATILNELEIPSPTGKKWSSGAIDKILHNQFYFGHLNWRVRNERGARKKEGEYDLILETHDAIIPPFLEEMVSQVREFKKEKGIKRDSPFLLKDIVYCDKCSEPLATKNYSAKGFAKNKENQKFVYRCLECKHYVFAQNIHDLTFEKFFTHLGSNKVKMKHDAIKYLKEWRNSLTKKLNKKLSIQKYIRDQERLFIYENNLDEYTQEMIEAISISLIETQSEIEAIQAALDQINRILNESDLDMLFQLFLSMQDNSLTDTELRVISLSFMKQINYSFETNSITGIDYLKTPFVSLELALDSLP
ncbi:recombinase family protein [Schinkia sp. CFF1]